MRSTGLILLLGLSIGCDRSSSAETAPAQRRADEAEVASAAEDTRSAEAAPVTEGAPTAEPIARPEPTGAAPTAIPDAPADPGPIVVRMADGSGEPVHLGTLRDWDGHTRRLPGHRLVESVWGFELRKGTKAAVTFRVPLSKPASVDLTIESPEVTTAAGLTVGQRFEEVRRRVDAMSCENIGGEGGTDVACDVGDGTFVEFHVSDEYFELPSPMTEAQAQAAVGKQVVTAVTWSTESAPEPVVRAEPAEPDRYGVLPAGVYWGVESYSPCELDLAAELCVPPRVAVVAGVFGDVAAAVAAVERTAGAGLEFGYPLVVHSDELGLVDEDKRGIAVVLALFAADAEAQAWIGEHAAISKPAVLPMLGPREAAARRGESEGPHDVVVRVRAGKTLGGVDCPLPGGSFSVATASDVSAEVYDTVPVRCPDGRETRIPWQHSLVEAVHVRTDRGRALVQLVGAECDSPAFRRWPVGDDGVAKGRGKLLAGPSCG